MFESDDYDEILSQFEFPEVATSKSIQHDPKFAKAYINDNENIKAIHHNSEKINGILEGIASTSSKYTKIQQSEYNNDQVLSQLVTSQLPSDRNSIPFQSNENKEIVSHCHKNLKSNEVQSKIISNKKAVDEVPVDSVSPKHMKRKMINAYFNHKTKRKFPGPAGILTNCIDNNKDETICQLELFSQDVDFTQNHFRSDIFESPLWIKLLDDLKDWNFRDIDSIKTIKQKTIAGSFRRKKANTVTAFIEAIDRSVTDPLVIMRDTTGTIKGTLHRDAWSAFSQFIASEYCALILWKPTILTTGAAFKKYYLNITLSNILAVYSSTVLNEETEKKELPHGYSIVYDDGYTVIKSLSSIQNTDGINELSNIFDSDLPEDLDSMFSDDAF